MDNLPFRCPEIGGQLSELGSITGKNDGLERFGNDAGIEKVVLCFSKKDFPFFLPRKRHSSF
jgi:hypothetical protein